LNTTSGTNPTDGAAGGTPGLRIDPRLRAEVVQAVMGRYGRIHIPGVLEHAGALAAYESISAPLPWQMHYNDGEQVFDLPAAEFDALPGEERAALLRPIYLRARLGFQYLYDSFPLSDHHERGDYLDLPLMKVFEFIKSEAVLEFARRITGVREIARVDAQATRYRHGHFLTAHDDRDDGNGRVAAYVLNLTPGWRTDWGGMLEFPDKDGHVVEGYLPTFNALNLFKVPVVHLVSPVAPFAGGVRLSVTGWFKR
jgi:hypothetical protein